jgi:hypothetical protein
MSYDAFLKQHGDNNIFVLEFFYASKFVHAQISEVMMVPKAYQTLIEQISTSTLFYQINQQHMLFVFKLGTNTIETNVYTTVHCIYFLTPLL